MENYYLGLVYGYFMPLTPFHLGPALLFGLIFFNYLDFPTFLVANVIVDMEPVIIILLNLDYPLHGFLHSFLSGTILAFLLAWVISRIRGNFSSLLTFFKLEQKSSFKSILPASLSGIYIHILLDSRMHMDIRPFYPLDFNPFLSSSTLPGLWVHIFCVWCFIGGVIIYVIKLFLTRRKVTK